VKEVACLWQHSTYGSMDMRGGSIGVVVSSQPTAIDLGRSNAP